MQAKNYEITASAGAREAGGVKNGLFGVVGIGQKGKR